MDKHQQSGDILSQTELGKIVAQTLHKLEYISDHHVKERRKNFRITNMIVLTISFLLVIIAMINVLYLYDFYDSTMRILDTTHHLDDTVVKISNSMVTITEAMMRYNQHMQSMQYIYQDMDSLAQTIPQMQSSLSAIRQQMSQTERLLLLVNRDIQLIDTDLHQMSYQVSLMGGNIHEMAKPMDKFNSFLP